MPERLTPEELQEIEEQRHLRLKALREEYRRTVPLINEDHYSRELPYQSWLEDVVLQREAEIKALHQEHPSGFVRVRDSSLTCDQSSAKWIPARTSGVASVMLPDGSVHFGYGDTAEEAGEALNFVISPLGYRVNWKTKPLPTIERGSQS